MKKLGDELLDLAFDDTGDLVLYLKDVKSIVYEMSKLLKDILKIQNMKTIMKDGNGNIYFPLKDIKLLIGNSKFKELIN